MATALDYVGERWTILIMRELLGGAARFSELRRGLPGIPSNLLTDRLKRLEEDGLVYQVHAQGAALYALTDEGASIRDTLESLAYWGARLAKVATPKHERSVRAMAMALQSILVRKAAAKRTDRLIIELIVDDEPLEMVFAQSPTATARHSVDAQVRLKTTSAAMAEVLKGNFVEKSFKHISGGQDSARQFFAIMTEIL